MARVAITRAPPWWLVTLSLLLLCLLPVLYTTTSGHQQDTFRQHPRRWPFPREQRSDATIHVVPVAHQGPTHQNPARAPPNPLLSPAFAPSSPAELSDLSGRSSFLAARSAHHNVSLAKRDGPLRCDDGPCIDGSCCGKDHICGFGPDFCGDGCLSQCNAKAMCGEYSENGEMPCGLKLCCSAMGWCGTTTEFCHNADPLRGTLPCQAGYGSCYISGAPSCPYGGGSTNGRMVGYYQSWNVRNRVCNKVSPRDLNTTGYTHLFYSFASIDPATYQIAPAHADDPAMMREFTGLAKDGLQTWIAIGGFDFSDPGTPTHTTWSDVCATKARRAAFIDSVKEYMDEYGFQGVDLDWEYPGDPSRGGNGLDDTKNLVLLVKEMRAAYGNAYGISLTLAPDYWYLRWFDPKGMEPYVDFFGFMAYDLHGSWDSDVLTLGKKVRGQADIREIANNTVPLWFDGLDPAKINFGLAMYGRGYTLADPTCNQLLCPFSGASDPAPCTNSNGVMSLLEIQQLIKRKGLTPQYLADSMMKQITWDDQWIGYDDEETFAAKKAWADSRCFGGTMVWSIDFQVTGSGNSDDETYGDVVYVGSEVFQEPTAQCPAPCVMVFPPSTLSEPKVVTIPPYSATLEVGTTTTTVVVVPTEVTTTITVIDFFNQYISTEQQPGEVMTLRPSFQPPPARVVVTGEDGQTTTRTVLPPPLGGGVGSVGGGGEPGPGQNQTGGVPVTSIPPAATDWPWVPPPTATPKPDVNDDDEVVPPFPQDSDSPPPPPDSTTPFPVDPTASIEPVIDPSKPPPPGGTRVRCTSWFFFICISWLDLNIKVDWWDIILPPGGIGPGPPPVSLLKLPPGWKIQCPGPLPCLPPWPKMTVGPGGEFPPEPAKPTPCEVTTATLTIESTSYGTTTTEGTVRTTTTRTFSSEFPILGCAITDATVATTVTACTAPTPLVRRFDDAISAAAAHQDDSGSIANDGNDVMAAATVFGAPLSMRADGDQCEDPRLVDAFCTAKDRLDEAKAIAWKQMIENERNANPRKYEDYTVVEIFEPFYIVGFVYLTQIRRDYLQSLSATGFFAGCHVMPREGPAPSRKRSSPGSQAASFDPAPVFNDTRSEPEDRDTLNKRAGVVDWKPHWALGYISVPPRRNVNAGSGQWLNVWTRNYKYQRDDSECQGQYVYVVENQFDATHPSLTASGATIEFLPRPREYGAWYNDLAVDPEHATGAASLVAGHLNGVCGKGKVTLVGTQIRGKRLNSGIPTGGSNLMLIEALLDTLEHISSRGTEARSVVLITWSFNMPTTPGWDDVSDLIGYIFEALDDQSIAVVMSSGNANNNDMHHLTPVEQLPQTLAEDIPNLILVGASDKQSRQAMYSRVGSDMVWAPGKEILVAGPHGIDQSLQTLDGTSYSGPLVAGLVAYYRGTFYEPGVESPLDDPEVVKKALKALSRTVQIRSYAQTEEPYVASNGNVFSWVVPTVWNGQLDDDTSCLLDSEAEGCPEIDLNRNLEDISIDDLDESCDTIPITKKRGVKRAGRSTRARRQSGGTCPLLPGEGGGGDGGGGDGGGGDGGGGGGDGGLSDQLGPAKTATYLSGPPSPTCTANCGTYCTDWWCRPNRTGQPPHFTEPTRLPSTTTRPPPPVSSSVRPPLSASGTIPGAGPTTSPPPLPDLSDDDAWPTNCASTRTYTRCAAPGGGHIVCVATSMCAATSTTAPPTPTPSEPSSRRWVAIYFSELTMSSGMGPPSWSRYWSVYAGDAGTDYCNDRSVFEKTDSGATLQDPEYPGSDLGSFKAHGRTCRYENAGRGAPGRVECEGTNPDWWETCRAAQLDDDPIFGGIKACGVFDNPMYKLVMLCSWGEA